LKFLFSCDASIRFRVMSSPHGASLSPLLDTTHSVEILWMSDQSVAENST